MKDTFFDRIALLLWRDRDGYDTTTGTMGEQHNISMRTRLRAVRYRVVPLLLNGRLWLAFIGGGFAVLAAVIPLYVASTKPAEQVNANTGELRLNCVEQGNGILMCRRAVGVDNKVTAGSNTVGTNDGAALNHGAEKK